jgi:hypothetical protein
MNGREGGLDGVHGCSSGTYRLPGWGTGREARGAAGRSDGRRKGSARVAGADERIMQEKEEEMTGKPLGS